MNFSKEKILLIVISMVAFVAFSFYAASYKADQLAEKDVRSPYKRDAEITRSLADRLSFGAPKVFQFLALQGGGAYCARLAGELSEGGQKPETGNFTVPCGIRIFVGLVVYLLVAGGVFHLFMQLVHGTGALAQSLFSFALGSAIAPLMWIPFAGLLVIPAGYFLIAIYLSRAHNVSYQNTLLATLIPSLYIMISLLHVRLLVL